MILRTRDGAVAPHHPHELQGPAARRPTVCTCTYITCLQSAELKKLSFLRASTLGTNMFRYAGTGQGEHADPWPKTAFLATSTNVASHCAVEHSLAHLMRPVHTQTWKADTAARDSGPDFLALPPQCASIPLHSASRSTSMLFSPAIWRLMRILTSCYLAISDRLACIRLFQGLNYPSIDRISLFYYYYSGFGPWNAALSFPVASPLGDNRPAATGCLGSEWVLLLMAGYITFLNVKYICYK